MNHKLLLSLHIMDEPKFEIHKIHNRRRSREQFKIQNSKFKIQKGVLLHSKTSPFATQKESFYTPKRVLLKAKRNPFGKHKGKDWKTDGKRLGNESPIST